jgi:hypothetical protein
METTVAVDWPASFECLHTIIFQNSNSNFWYFFYFYDFFFFLVAPISEHRADYSDFYDWLNEKVSESWLTSKDISHKNLSELGGNETTTVSICKLL